MCAIGQTTTQRMWCELLFGLDKEAHNMAKLNCNYTKYVYG